MTAILSWNVNGIRASLKKGLLDWLKIASPDVICFQETKAFPGQLPPELLHPPGYEAAWNSALRPGYSGVSTWSKTKPVAVRNGLGIKKFDEEGRMLETEFKDFTLLNIYFPNGKMNEERLKFKMEFYEEALKYFKKLTKKGKRLVICGDYNTAHKPIDLSRPKENERVSGFLPMERAWMDKLEANGFADTFRVFNQDPGHYTWWDLISRARERNVGWRIDYFFISENLKPRLENAFILSEVMGSDHCPVGVTLNC
ncbi:MAG: exodeoxyribonuclease III [Candidatus Omnitrophica bacterium CG07_land_8_20_14_0_80_50_8]|nr:MAG: exodeoxyribonuclease III [Candidatus Omnitrophica bacterium CG07_land_8_20_14_0_80_50_8]